MVLLGMRACDRLSSFPFLRNRGTIDPDSCRPYAECETVPGSGAISAAPTVILIPELSMLS